jgi:hypothetical protein
LTSQLELNILTSQKPFQLHYTMKNVLS